MKKIMILSLLTILLLILGCESPLKVKAHELNEAIGSEFNRNVLKQGGDCSVGYYNGRIQTDQVTLSWSEATDENFHFYKLTRDGEELAVYNDISTTTFEDSTVTEDNYYNYQITVFIESGMVAKDTIEIKTAKWQAPSNLTANGLSDTDVKLMWDDNADSEEYTRIYLYNSYYTIIDSFTVGANINERIVTNLNPVVEYHFDLKAVGEWEDDTPLSSNESFDMQDFVLVAPSNLFGTQMIDQMIRLEWQDNSTLETGFIVERKINNGNYVEIADLDEINLEYYFDENSNEYEAGDLLTYRVKSYNDYEGLEYTGYSNECEIVVLDYDGIEEDFSDNIADNWIDDGSGRWGITDNQYRMSGNYGGEALAYFDEVIANFTYEVDVTKVSGGYTTGLYFRGDGTMQWGDIQNGYFFNIDSDYGEYNIILKINGYDYWLANWTYCEYINPNGVANNLRVNCEGENMNFFINGHLVDSIVDDTYASGFQGVWAYDNYDTVDFDNVRLEYGSIRTTVANTAEVRKSDLVRADKNEIYNYEVMK